MVSGKPGFPTASKNQLDHFGIRDFAASRVGFENLRLVEKLTTCLPGLDSANEFLFKVAKRIGCQKIVDRLSPGSVRSDAHADALTFCNLDARRRSRLKNHSDVLEKPFTVVLKPPIEVTAICSF